VKAGGAYTMKYVIISSLILWNLTPWSPILCCWWCNIYMQHRQRCHCQEHNPSLEGADWSLILLLLFCSKGHLGFCSLDEISSTYIGCLAVDNFVLGVMDDLLCYSSTLVLPDFIIIHPRTC
jgi:hypothetical protein